MSDKTADEFDIALARNVATLTDAHLAEFEQTLRGGLPMRERLYFDAYGDGNPSTHYQPCVRADHVLMLVVALREARAEIARLKAQEARCPMSDINEEITRLAVEMCAFAPQFGAVQIAALIHQDIVSSVRTPFNEREWGALGERANQLIARERGKRLAAELGPLPKITPEQVQREYDARDARARVIAAAKVVNEVEGDEPNLSHMRTQGSQHIAELCDAVRALLALEAR